MADDRVPAENLPAELNEVGGEIHPLADHEASSSLVADLIPIVDEIRQIPTDFGVRPYRVFLVHGRWTGDRRGNGKFIVSSRREIIPTPRVRDMSQVSMRLKSTGRTEEGGVYVDEVSGRYAEDDLLGVTPDLADPVLGATADRLAEFYWEVEQQRLASPPEIRRFVPEGVPSLEDGFQWSIRLIKQDFDRRRDGATRRAP